jgi:hypothetical protein
LERLVTQKLLDVVQKVAKQELESDSWLKLVAQLSGRSYEEMRVTVLEFLDTDVFATSAEDCISYLDPLIDSWDIDLTNFGMGIVLNRRLAPVPVKKVEFVETESASSEEEPGLRKFLADSSMSGDASEEEIAFLKRLRFTGSRPTALYYYRELQSLRDPLHFPGLSTPPRRRTKPAGRFQPKGSVAPMHKHREANRIEKQMQLDSTKKATQRWARKKTGHAENDELGLEQKDLAAAAGVTDSYIPQLLTRKKLPPAPDRTDIYVKMGKFLKLPAGKLSELAEHQRTEELKKGGFRIQGIGKCLLAQSVFTHEV